MENVERFALFHSLPYLISLSLLQGRSEAGHTTRAGHACDPVSSQVETFSHFIFWTTIPPCPTGSKGWSKSSGNVVYGQLRASTCSVQISTAPPNVLTAAVGGSFFHSRTSLTKNHNFKSSSSRVVTFVTFIQSTTAN